MRRPFAPQVRVADGLSQMNEGPLTGIAACRPYVRKWINISVSISVLDPPHVKFSGPIGLSAKASAHQSRPQGKSSGRS